MIEGLILLALAVAGGLCLYAYRWGFAEGRNEGYEDGLADRVAPEPQGGGGPQPQK